MQNLEYRPGSIHFAELETGGKRVECPTCHVPFKPHLGNMIAARFQCGSCKANITFRSTTGRTVRCSCCRFSRPMPSLSTLSCGGCDATVIYRKDDPTVKCFLCKHEANYVTPQVNRVVLPQVNRVVPPEMNRAVPPQDNRVVLPQVNRVVLPEMIPSQVNPVVPPEMNRVVPLPPQDNRVVPPQVNRVVPPQVNRMNRTATAETESIASSSSPKPESLHSNVDENPDSVAHFMKSYVRGLVEEDKTSKKQEDSTLIY